MASPSIKPFTQVEAPSTTQWIRAGMGWQFLLALLGLGGMGAVWTAVTDTALWLRLLLTFLLVLWVGVCGLSIQGMNGRHHNGRFLALATNYLAFLFCLVGSFQVLGIFFAFDDLAHSFGRGIPFLFTAFIGYLITTLGDRWEYQPRLQKNAQMVGKWVALLSGLAFLWAINLPQGLLALLRQLQQPLGLFLVVGTLLFAFFLWAFSRRPIVEAFHTTQANSEMISGYLFLSPNLLGFLIFFAGPLFFSLYVSFTDWDSFGTKNWVGFANYARIVNFDVASLDSPDQRANEVLDVKTYDELNRFTLFGKSYVVGTQDKLFWIALGNTITFVLLAVPLSVIPALVLANFLNSKIPGMTFFRAIYFLPSVAAVVGIALVWQWLFNATIGYINYAIALLANWLHFTDPQIRWLSDSKTALLAVVIMSAWQWIGFNTVLFLAGLQNIPGDLYEAATVDGANSWTQFWKITLPLLASTTFFVITTTVIQAMQVFEQVFILMPGNNPQGPGNATLTLVLYLYQKGFQRFEQGYASAIAWVLFLLIFGATLLQFQRQRATGES